MTTMMVMIEEEGEDDDGTEQSDTEYLKNHWKTKKIQKNQKKQSTVPKKPKKPIVSQLSRRGVVGLGIQNIAD